MTLPQCRTISCHESVFPDQLDQFVERSGLPGGNSSAAGCAEIGLVVHRPVLGFSLFVGSSRKQPPVESLREWSMAGRDRGLVRLVSCCAPSLPFSNGFNQIQFISNEPGRCPRTVAALDRTLDHRQQLPSAMILPMPGVLRASRRASVSSMATSIALFGTDWRR